MTFHSSCCSTCGSLLHPPGQLRQKHFRESTAPGLLLGEVSRPLPSRGLPAGPPSPLPHTRAPQMLLRNHREGPSLCGRELPGEGVLSTQTPDSRAGLLPTEVITARQAQSHVQNMVADRVSKDTRMTSKRGWARSAQEAGGGGGGESGMSWLGAPLGTGWLTPNLPLPGPALLPAASGTHGWSLSPG